MSNIFCGNCQNRLNETDVRCLTCGRLTVIATEADKLRMRNKELPTSIGILDSCIQALVDGDAHPDNMKIAAEWLKLMYRQHAHEEWKDAVGSTPRCDICGGTKRYWIDHQMRCVNCY